jgi:hypothetical protein
MLRARGAIRLSLCILVLAGCAAPGPTASPAGSPAGPTDPATPTDAGTAAPTQVAFAGAPGRVALRDPLPLCGVEQSGGPGNTPDAALRRCFLEAYLAGRPAELVSRLTTIEGARVTVIYRTRRGEPIEVFWDNTQDPLGSQAWETYGCAGLHEVEPGDPSGLAVTEVFALDGCTEARQIR